MPKVRDAIQLVEKDGWLLDRTREGHHYFNHAVKKGIVAIAGSTLAATEERNSVR